MNYTFLLFVVLLVGAALLQVTWIPIPIGLLLVLFWAWQKDERGAVLLSLIFSIVLASLSAMDVWLVFLSTGISLYLFILLRSFLPSRPAVNLAVLIVLVLFWELSLLSLETTVNL